MKGRYSTVRLEVTLFRDEEHEDGRIPTNKIVYRVADVLSRIDDSRFQLHSVKVAPPRVVVP